MQVGEKVFGDWATDRHTASLPHDITGVLECVICAGEIVLRRLHLRSENVYEPRSYYKISGVGMMGSTRADGQSVGQADGRSPHGWSVGLSDGRIDRTDGRMIGRSDGHMVERTVGRSDGGSDRM